MNIRKIRDIGGYVIVFCILAPIAIAIWIGYLLCALVLTVYGGITSFINLIKGDKKWKEKYFVD